MKRYIILSLVVVIGIMLLPVVSLSSLTDLSALASSRVTIFSAPRAKHDLYDYGECTYWVSLRRSQISEPIPNTWGNAITWAVRASANGYLVDHHPSYGAIMQDPNALGGLGHVAFVERVNLVNGDWIISEMNRVGWDEVDWRTMTPTEALSYYFIH